MKSRGGKNKKKYAKKRKPLPDATHSRYPGVDFFNFQPAYIWSQLGLFG